MENVDLIYQQTLNYLYSFVDYSLTRQLQYSPEKFNLDHMKELLDLMGNPQTNYPVVHVAGTKGKGSTCAMIEGVLRAGGLRVGLYTSPHLQEYTERIQINRQEISKEDLIARVEELKPHIAKIPQLTTFELTTAIAFETFSRNKVDVAVVEVGLGGRLDSTNIVDPVVSVITSLSMDHMNVLGDTLAAIAGEKAGIIKVGRPVVVSPQKDEALQVVRKVAQEKNAPLTQVGEDYCFADAGHSLNGQSLYVWEKGEQTQMDAFLDYEGKTEWQPVHLTIPLLGYHQVVNAATAFTTLRVLSNLGWKLSLDVIRKGFSQVQWPGRFEVINQNPLIIVDSAHNQDSALKLRLTVDDYLPEQAITLVFGVSEDKDVHGMFVELLPRVKRVVVTQSQHPRAMSSQRLADMVHQFGRPAILTTTIEDALAQAVAAADDGSAILVAGSLFVAAAARETWKKKQKGKDEK